jgi:protein involved in polysaccharide export with SLBB domain
MQEGDTFTVGIELDRALASPGSEYDPILREGDRIFIPELQNTVRISGNVLYPNAVTYVPGKSVDYYVSAAGGYGFRAKRNKTYIVYQNGNVRKVGVFSAKVEPGCEIIVPERPERKGMSAGEIVSLGTSTASLGMMVVTLINTLRK